MTPRRHVLYLPGYVVARHHQGIVRYARRAGWVLNATMAYTGTIPETRDYDGIISFHDHRPDILAKLRERGVPTVDLSPVVLDPPTPKVLHDHEAIGRLAGEHLVARGFRRVAYVGWFRGPNDPGRAAGLEKAVKAAGREFIRIPIDAMIERIRAIPKPLAIMLQNDMHASEAQMKLIAEGFDIPNEIAVIGSDNDELYCETAPVSLTSVDSGVEACGYEAARMLDAMMDGASPPAAPLLIPAGPVVARDSTRVVAIDHAPTSRAVTEIRRRFTEPLDLDALARSVGLGRRRLDDLCRIHLGHPMAAEVRRLRLEAATARIGETDDKLADIATSCGFTDGAHLTHAFRAQHGETPDARRRAARASVAQRRVS